VTLWLRIIANQELWLVAKLVSKPVTAPNVKEIQHTNAHHHTPFNPQSDPADRHPCRPGASQINRASGRERSERALQYSRKQHAKQASELVVNGSERTRQRNRRA
jgi:hypothetical protein